MRPGRRSGIPTSLTVGLAFVAFAFGPAVARADLTWSTDSQIVSAAGQDSTSTRVAVDDAGDAIVAWVQSDGSHPRVRAAIRPAGGNFGAPVTLSTAGYDASAPAVAMAPDGSALVVWSRAGGPSVGGADIEASYRPAGGNLGAVENLTAGDNPAVGPAVAMDAQGNALVLWSRSPDSHLEAVLRPPSGTYGAIQNNIYAAGSGQYKYIAGIAVAFDQAGNAVAAWQSQTNGSSGDNFPAEIHAAVRPAGGTFGTQQKLDDRHAPDYPQSLDAPSVAMYSGNAFVSWTRDVGAGTAAVDYAYRASGQASFGAVQQLAGSVSDRANAAFGAQILFTPVGDMLALWTGELNYVDSVQSSYAPAGGSFPAGSSASPTGVVDGDAGMDGSGNTVALWSTDNHTKFEAAFRPAGASSTFATPVPLGDYDAGPDLAVAKSGAAVAVWTVSDGTNLVVHAAFGTPPAATPPPPPPPPPPAPEPSAIQPARPIKPGEAVVLTAQVTGAVDRLEWTFAANTPPVVGQVVNGTLQRSVRFRAPRSFSVTVKAVGPGGSKTYTRSFTGPRDTTDDDSQKVNSALDHVSTNVYAVGDAAVLTGQSKTCGQVSVYAVSQVQAGCFLPIDDIGDIPSADLGVLDRLASGLKLNRSDAGLMSKAVSLSDGYVATGTVTINGLWPVVPGAGARIVSYPQVSAMVASNASIRFGPYAFRPSGAGFNLTLDPLLRTIPLGPVPKPPGLTNIGGFPLTGDFDVTLRPGDALIKTTLQLPGFISRFGVPLQTPIQMRALSTGLVPQDILIGPTNVDFFGILPVNSFKITYDQANDQWTGQGQTCPFSITCLDLVPPDGGIRIKNGQLSFMGVDVTYQDPGKALAPGVFLEHLGVGFGLDPTRLIGKARVGFGPFVKVDGNAVIAFPSVATPYMLNHAEVGDAFPAGLYTQHFTAPTIALGAEESVNLPVLGDLHLANGYLLYELGGYAAFGGGANQDILGIFNVGGSISGEMDVSKGVYNLHGDIHVCLDAVRGICGGSVTNISRGLNGAGGAGACVQLGPVSVGGGVQWAHPSKPLIWPFDGCKWSRFKIDVRAARIAATDAPYTVKIKAGQANPAVQLTGTTAAPLVRVSGPNGLTLDSTDAGLDMNPGGTVRILRFENATAKLTVVGFEDAAPGTYTITPLPASAPIANIARASDPQAAKITAKVGGRGLRRVLAYRIRRRSNQTVTFYDTTASGASRRIGVVKGGGKGKLTFHPSPGRSTHAIAARFALDGVPAENLTVAHFKPPSPVLPKPRALRSRHKGSRLLVSWRRVGGAKRYEVVVTLSNGRQRFAQTRSSQLVVRGVPASLAGTVSVRGEASLRHGKVAKRHFRNTKKRKTTLQSLPVCRVHKHKVTCQHRG